MGAPSLAGGPGQPGIAPTERRIRQPRLCLTGSVSVPVSPDLSMSRLCLADFGLYPFIFFSLFMSPFMTSIAMFLFLAYV